MATASWPTCRDRTWCDHPSFVQIGPLVGELWHFPYVQTRCLSAILNFKNFDIWSRDCQWGPICRCLLNFIKTGSHIQPPDAHNCWMLNAPLLGNGRCHKNLIMADMRRHDGIMWPPKFRPNRYIGRRVMAFPTFSNMAAVRHLELEFCPSGPPAKSTVRSNYCVKIWCRSDLPRWRYCNFMILRVWLENA